MGAGNVMVSDRCWEQARPQKSNHRGAIEILRGAGHEKAVSSIEQRVSPTYVDAWVHRCNGSSILNENMIGFGG